MARLGSVEEYVGGEVIGRSLLIEEGVDRIGGVQQGLERNIEMKSNCHLFREEHIPEKAAFAAEAFKALLLSIFSQKLPRQRKSLTVQGDLGKIIDVVRRKSCFLSV